MEWVNSLTLSEIENRILNKLDKMDDKIDDLCHRVTKQEVRYNTHIENEIQRNDFRFKVLTLMVGVIGSSFALLNILRFVEAI
jgi:uncharacterized membrane protein YjjP (DUF1212 family)